MAVSGEEVTGVLEHDDTGVYGGKRAVSGKVTGVYKNMMTLVYSIRWYQE